MIDQLNMLSKINIEFFAAFAIMCILAPIFIPILHKFKFGQTIRNEGPESHLVKNGTPTMGGIMIIAAFAIPSILFLFGEGQKEVLPAFLMTLLFGLVGFLDDYLKVKKKNSTGLRAWQKMSLQIVFTIAILVYMYYFTDIPMTLKVPFVPGLELNLGIFILFFDFVVILGTDTGANFTDGLDGLVSKVTIVILLFMFFVALKEGNVIMYPIMAMIGALSSFLLFNAYPAKVFMGDTGALAIGGFVAICAIILKLPIFLVIIAFVYVAEVGSVMMQVSYFKLTKGKRIFKMTPIHHHFEKCGWKETKVVTVFTIVTVLLCMIAYLGV